MNTEGSANGDCAYSPGRHGRVAEGSRFIIVNRVAIMKNTSYSAGASL